ncbi:Dabb family protein [Myroides sp. LJL119]
MITHVVMWKLKQLDKQENAIRLKNELLALKKTIEVIKAIRVDFNLQQAPEDNFDVVLTLELENWEDLQIYANHPDHVKIIDFVRSIVTQRVAIDY